MKLDSKNRVECYDGLRAIASLSVFFLHYFQIAGIDDRAEHFSWRRMLEFGFGVSVFILLSGALMGREILKWEAFRPAFGRFLVQKVFRLATPYYLALLCMAIWELIMYRACSLLDYVVHLLFIHNISDRTLYSISPPFWYLAVQFQAYCIVPVIVYVLAPVKFRSDLRSFSLVVVAFVCWGVFVACIDMLKDHIPAFAAFIQANPMCVSHSVFAHLPNFLLGAACSGFFSFRGKYPLWIQVSFDFLILFLIGGLVFFSLIGEEAAVSLPNARYGFPALVFPLMTMIFLLPRSYAIKRLFEARGLVLLGSLSYGFYIFHYPAIMLSVKLCNALSGSVAFVASAWMHCVVAFFMALLASYVVQALVWQLSQSFTPKWFQKSATRK